MFERLSVRVLRPTFEHLNTRTFKHFKIIPMEDKSHP